MEQDELFNISDEQLSDLEKTVSDLDSDVKPESESVENSESSEDYIDRSCAFRQCEINIIHIGEIGWYD